MAIGSSLPDLAKFIVCPDQKSQSLDRNLFNLLRAVRTHLNMEMSFISEFVDGQRVFRYVDGVGPEEMIRVGDSSPLEASFCQRIVDGRLPQVLPDAMRNHEAAMLANAAGIHVGAHISVPIRLKSGEIYGTFCCFSSTPDESLNERDLAVINVFAEVAGALIDQEIESQKSLIQSRDRIASVIESDALQMVYQPIASTVDKSIVGFESLSRFSVEPIRPPDEWFKEAALVGKSIELEQQSIRQGLCGLAELPQDKYVSVNVSPSTIISCDVPKLFEGVPVDRVVVEITEHAVIDDYSKLYATTQELKELGMRIAVDDAGAGYANFRLILNLNPEIIKVDASITRDIDTHLSRRALAAAIIGFANETESKVIAEGVETEDELAVLKDLGVTNVQGYLLGKPMSLEDAISFDQECICND